MPAIAASRSTGKALAASRGSCVMTASSPVALTRLQRSAPGRSVCVSVGKEGISCGLAGLVSEGNPNMTLGRLKATSAVHRLINPSEMGELFKVLAFGKGVTDPLVGFQSARHLQL